MRIRGGADRNGRFTVKEKKQRIKRSRKTIVVIAAIQIVRRWARNGFFFAAVSFGRTVQNGQSRKGPSKEEEKEEEKDINKTASRSVTDPSVRQKKKKKPLFCFSMDKGIKFGRWIEKKAAESGGGSRLYSAANRVLYPHAPRYRFQSRTGIVSFFSLSSSLFKNI